MDSPRGLGNLLPLTELTLHPAERNRYALAIAAGLPLAAAFPNIGVTGLAWLAPGMMLAAAMGQRGGMAFRIGYVAGLAHYLTSLYWLLLIPVNKAAPAAGWLALAAFLALYPATWVWFCWKIYPARMDEGGPDIISLLDSFLATRWTQRFGWALTCAALWVAWEMTQARLLSGFPWNFLGASQYQMLLLIQIASFTGVYGLSFLIVWFSVSLLCATVALIRRPTPRWSWMAELIVPLLCVVAVTTGGMRKVFHEQPESANVKIALVQPSIPQTLIWNEKEDMRRFGKVIELSEAALAAKPDLLVWPEAAVPSFVRWDTNINSIVTNFVRRHRVWLILGSDDLELKEHPRHAEDFEYFNSSFLVSPDGEFVAGYRKRKLVIFGEYVPLARWLPFLKHLTPITGAFTPGQAPVPFTMPDLKVKTSVLICFEDIFPHLVREYVEDDTDFLLNLTNNGWFGESAAQWQHAASAVFRAVENGLPLVRCANNGLTCWVDAQGRLHQVYFPRTNDIYGVGFKIVQVPVLAGQKRAPTFYRQHGDWFGWGCVGLAAAMVAACSFRRQKTN